MRRIRTDLLTKNRQVLGNPRQSVLAAVSTKNGLSRKCWKTNSVPKLHTLLDLALSNTIVLRRKLKHLLMRK